MEIMVINHHFNYDPSNPYARITSGPLPATSRVRDTNSQSETGEDHGSHHRHVSEPVRRRSCAGYRAVNVVADATRQVFTAFQLRGRQRFRNRLSPPGAQPPVRTDLLRSTFRPIRVSRLRLFFEELRRSSKRAFP